MGWCGVWSWKAGLTAGLVGAPVAVGAYGPGGDYVQALGGGIVAAALGRGAQDGWCGEVRQSARSPVFHFELNVRCSAVCAGT